MLSTPFHQTLCLNAGVLRPRPIPGRHRTLASASKNHYAVLGVSRLASVAEIKRAYRLLARKYHPDVNKDAQAGETFKSIQVAYEALANDTTRSQYDRQLEFQEASGRSYPKNWAYDPEIDDGRRAYRWAELRYQVQYERQKRRKHHKEKNEAYSETSRHHQESLADLLLFVFVTLFFAQTIGTRLTLLLCSLSSLFDSQLDSGYKMGYAVALYFGGCGGVLLALCFSFTVWLYGKKSSGLVALVVLAMGVGATLSRFVYLPQGALVALLYMSMKLQVDLK